MPTTPTQTQPPSPPGSPPLTTVGIGTADSVESWTEAKRLAFAAGIAAKLGCDPSAITITVTAT